MQQSSISQKTNQSPPPEQGIKSYQRFGLILLFLLVGGIGGWSVLASLQGAVIAPGQVTVKANLKMVQHLEGGIVAKIHVEEGQRVKAGDILIELNTTKDTANLAALDSNLNELQAAKARLISERDKSPTITYPKDLLARAKTNPDIQTILKGQENLKTARKATLDGQTNQLKQRIEQLNEVVKGLNAQTTSKQQQLALIKKELTDLEILKAQGLVPQTRFLALEREKARLEGESGELLANTARTKVQISETESQILQISKESLSNLLAELRQTTTKVNQLKEQRTALADKLTRMKITAPKTGIVHQLAVHTIGGVVAPGDPVLMIVPQQTEMIIAARVAPEDIDQVFKGQIANIRLASFDQRTTPEVNGRVTLVPADATQDQPNTPPYYKVHIELPKYEIARLKGKELVSGMTAEVFIQTKARPVFEYLLQPLTDQINRAMRES